MLSKLFKTISLLALIFTAAQTQAAKVESAQLVGTKLVLDVSHGGGCGEHLYDIELGGCFETFPVQCSAELIHVTDDICEALLYRTVEIDLAEKGLFSDGYFSGASLTITGDEDWSTGEKSRATVVLPRF